MSEIWDLYNEQRQIIGEHTRGEELLDNNFMMNINWCKLCNIF